MPATVAKTDTAIRSSRRVKPFRDDHARGLVTRDVILGSSRPDRAHVVPTSVLTRTIAQLTIFQSLEEHAR